MQRIWVLILLLAGTLGIVEVRGDHDRVPESVPLAQMPEVLGPWEAKDMPIAPSVLEVLGQGFFLNRVYSEAQPTHREPPVGVFIGYFPTQRSGQSIHSPQNCLPGAGWSFDSSGVLDWSQDGHRYRVGDYLISNGTDRQEVLYWYRSHGRDIANDYAAKFYMLRDAIVFDRSDAALIRVSTPMMAGETQRESRTRLLAFARLLTPTLSTYIPN